MSEDRKVKTYAVDDVEFIAKRLKEIQAEKVVFSADDVPSDVEPMMWPSIYSDMFWKYAGEA